MAVKPRNCTTCRYSQEDEDYPDQLRCRRYPPGGDYVDVPNKPEKKRGFPLVDKD